MLLSSYSNQYIEAGCDEAGRGCLAGPVFAAAVILPSDYKNPDLNDSKQLTHSQRDQLRYIIETEAVAFAVAQVSPSRIDQINILNASFEAMNIAVEELTATPQLLLIDGNRFRPQSFIPYQCIVKGDSKYMSIAAASILAKTYRDELMQQLHNIHPQYGWNQNKGYPTLAHRHAIIQHGLTPHHRISFRFKT